MKIIAVIEKHNCKGRVIGLRYIVHAKGFKGKRKRLFYLVKMYVNNGISWNVQALQLKSVTNNLLTYAYVKKKLRGHIKYQYGSDISIDDYKDENFGLIQRAIQKSPEIIKPWKEREIGHVANFSEVKKKWEQIYRDNGIDVDISSIDTASENNLSQVDDKSKENTLQSMRENFYKLTFDTPMIREQDLQDLYADLVTYEKILFAINDPSYKSEVKEQVKQLRVIIPIIETRIKYIATPLAKIICKFLLPTYTNPTDLRKIRIAIWKSRG